MRTTGSNMLLYSMGQDMGSFSCNFHQTWIVYANKREKKNYRNNLFEKFDLFSANRFAIFMLCYRLCSVCMDQNALAMTVSLSVWSNFDDTLQFPSECALCMRSETKRLQSWLQLISYAVSIFFSTHRLHSLPLQYHLHFNVRLESWNGIFYFQIHLPNALDNVLVHFICGSVNHQVWFVMWFKALPILLNAKFEYSGPLRKLKYLKWVEIENTFHRCS